MDGPRVPWVGGTLVLGREGITVCAPYVRRYVLCRYIGMYQKWGKKDFFITDNLMKLSTNHIKWEKVYATGVRRWEVQYYYTRYVQKSVYTPVDVSSHPISYLILSHISSHLISFRLLSSVQTSCTAGDTGQQVVQLHQIQYVLIHSCTYQYSTQYSSR